MTIKQAKECLESIDILKYRDDDKNYFFDDVKDALDIAIKSLDMWDKFSDEIEELLDKRYCEKEGKVQDNLAEGFFQSEKAIKRRIKEIKKEIEE